MVKEIVAKNNHSAPPSPELEIAQSTADICAHHWLIETPQGQKSQGTCKNCGNTRLFVNSSDYPKGAYMGQVVRSPGDKPPKDSPTKDYDGPSLND